MADSMSWIEANKLQGKLDSARMRIIDLEYALAEACNLAKYHCPAEQERELDASLLQLKKQVDLA